MAPYSDVGTGIEVGGGREDQLTKLRPGRVDYTRLLLLAPQCFSPSGITAITRVFFQEPIIT